MNKYFIVIILYIIYDIYMDKLLRELMAAGLTEQAIVNALADKGVKTNQSSISKFKNGVYKNYNYDLANAIVELHRQICAKKKRKG